MTYGSSEKLKLHNKVIDDGHFALYKAAMKLMESSDDSVNKIERRYHKFLDAYVNHCMEEEVMMMEIRYIYAQQHISSHRLIQEMILSLERPIIHKQLPLKIVTEIMSRVFALHIKDEDAMFVKVLHGAERKKE